MPGGWSGCLLDVARVPFFPALHHAGGETPAPGLVTAVVRDWLAREILLGHEWVSIPRSRVLQTPEVPGDLCSRGRSIPCPATNRRLPTGLARGVLCGRAAAWSSNHARKSFFSALLQVSCRLPGASEPGVAVLDVPQVRARLDPGYLFPVCRQPRDRGDPGRGHPAAAHCCCAGGPFLSGPPQPVAQSVSGFPPGKTGTRPMIWRVRTSWRLPFMTLKPFHLCAPM